MRYLKHLLIIMMALLIGFTVILPVSAANGNVTYSGDSGQFIFAPGSDYSPTDLFPNFKDVMPGDSINQRILIKNNASNKVKINVYMRSLGAHADSVDFLSKLNLRVEKLTDTELFDAPADQSAQLTDWVLLGTLYSGGEIELDIILEVPVTLDNINKNLIGYLDWEFMIEEFPIEDSDPTPVQTPVSPSTGGESPKTGDDSDATFYLVMTVCGFATLGLLVRLRRRDRYLS